MRHALMLLLVTSALLTGCGSSDSDDPSTTAADPTSPAEATPGTEMTSDGFRSFAASFPTLPASLPGGDGSFALVVDVRDDFEQDLFRFDVLNLSSIRGEQVELQTYSADTLSTAAEAVDVISAQIQRMATDEIDIQTSPITIEGASSAVLVMFGETRIDEEEPFRQWSVIMEEPRSGQVWVWRYTGPADRFDETTAGLQLDTLRFMDVEVEAQPPPSETAPDGSLPSGGSLSANGAFIRFPDDFTIESGSSDDDGRAVSPAGDAAVQIFLPGNENLPGLPTTLTDVVASFFPRYGVPGEPGTVTIVGAEDAVAVPFRSGEDQSDGTGVIIAAQAPEGGVAAWVYSIAGSDLDPAVIDFLLAGNIGFGVLPPRTGG